MFLIPAMGFYYTRHSCLKSGHVQMVLDRNYTCCTQKEQKGHDLLSLQNTCCAYEEIEQETSCCDMESSRPEGVGNENTLKSASSNCCINDGNYLKSKDEFTPPGKVEMPRIEFIVNAALFSIDLFSDIQETTEEYAHSPPFIPSTADILHSHSVLLI